MNSIRHLAAAMLVGVCSSAASVSANPPPRVVVISDADCPEAELTPAIGVIAGMTRATVLEPAKARAMLARAATFDERRRHAAVLFAEATTLVQNIRYGGALAKLEDAEREARAGLARFVEPKLLADIYLQRGLALLATDTPAARRWFVSSFQLWPERQLDESIFAPRIVHVLRRSAREAREADRDGLHPVEAARIARLLDAEALVFIQVSTAGQVQASGQRFKNRAGREAAVAVSWQSGATPAELRAALRPLSSVLAVQAEPSPAPAQPRRILVWTLLGVGGAALGAGIGLTVYAANQADQAHSLANASPLVEYAPRVRDLEQNASRSRAGAAACFSISGAAVVGAVVLWLLQRKEAAGPRVTLAPGGASVAWQLP